jgi:TRAP-type C4-dicarboxylate transport system permease small subunit
VTRFAEAVERWLKVFTAALLAAMVAVILAQVIFRYAVNMSLAWTEEVGRYLFVWICLFGAALGYRYSQHSGYESVVAALPPRAARWVMTGVDALVALFSVVLIVASRELIEAGMGQLTPATQFRIAYIYVAFPLSGLITLLFVADAARARWRHPKEAPAAPASAAIGG